MKIQSYTVWSLDVWGHCGVDCKKHHCDCVGEDGQHDDAACECFFEVNDRFRSGEIEVEGTEKTYNVGTPRQFSSLEVSDDRIVEVLVSEGFLKEGVRVSDVTIDDCGIVACSKTGEPVFYIEAKEEQNRFQNETLTPFFA